MIITAREVEKYNEITMRKVQIFKKMFPDSKAEFNPFGRAELTVMKELTEFAVDGCLLTTHPSGLFVKAMVESCENKKISHLYGYELENWPREYPFLFKCLDYAKNLVRVRDCSGRFVDYKVSRLLAGAHDVWRKYIPTYDLLKTEEKRLRTFGMTYEDKEIQSLSESKKFYEEGNFFVLYENILNSFAGSKLMISLNPLDKLSLSGGSGCGANPTAFNTCWSTNMRECENGIDVTMEGNYSNPVAQLALGSSDLSCTIYIPNGRTLKVPDSDFFFTGYCERSNAWLDEGSIFIERMYPSKMESRKNEIIAALKSIGLNVVDECILEDKFQLTKFKRQIEPAVVQDYASALKDGKPLFLDRVALIDGELYRFPLSRVEYSDWDTIDGEPLYCMRPGSHSSDEFEAEEAESEVEETEPDFIDTDDIILPF